MPVYYWFPVLGCLGIGIMFMNIPPVATQFMQLFGVGYSGLSFFLSSLFWTHALAQIPAGLIIDRLGILRSLVISAILCTACSLAPFLAPQGLGLAIVRTAAAAHGGTCWAENRAGGVRIWMELPALQSV